MEYFASAINYPGSKRRLLPQILPHLRGYDYMIDAFCGSAVVGINAPQYNLVLNDQMTQLVDMLEFLAIRDLNDIRASVYRVVNHYGLSDSGTMGYQYYGVDSSRGLAKVNRVSYEQLRTDYNSGTLPYDPRLILYILSVYSFNNQIRFNRDGAFNSPVGKRDFGTATWRKLSAFQSAIAAKSVVFSSLDFRAVLGQLGDSDLVYADPPYRITRATYNEAGAWTREDDVELCNSLDQVVYRGGGFAMTNMLNAKGRPNDVLIEWLAGNDYTVIDLLSNFENSSYHRIRRIGANDREVLILGGIKA